MSELKARTARSIADEEEILELGADCPIEQAQVYLKSEADMVIAEKDAEIARLKAKLAEKDKEIARQNEAWNRLCKKYNKFVSLKQEFCEKFKDIELEITK